MVLDAQPQTPVTIRSASLDPSEGLLTTPQDLTFTPTTWNTPQTLTIQGQDDALVDGDITYDVRLRIRPAVSDDFFDALPDMFIPVINLDNDYEATISATDATAQENTPSNDSAIFVVDLGSANNTGGPITVNYTIGGSATIGADYATIATSVSIPNGAQTAQITITPVDDNFAEPVENVSIELQPGTGYVLGAPAAINETITIQDNDIPGVNFSTASGPTSEAGGTATFTINLDTQPTDPVTVALSSNDTGEGTVPPSVTIPVADWDIGVTVTVTGVDDNIVDGDQTYTIITGNVTSADPNYNSLGAGAVPNRTVTNLDDDAATITINDVSVNEDVAGGNMEFEVTLDVPVSGGFTVAYSFANGSATGGGTDFTGTNGTLTFTGTANEVEIITVSINNDQLLEPTEDFTVQLGPPSNPGVTRVGGGLATGEINDDDNCAPAPILDTTVPTIFCDVID